MLFLILKLIRLSFLTFAVSQHYSLRYMIIFLKNFLRSRISLRLYMMSALRRYRSCFVSLRFRWDCKGRNLFGFSKINVKIYFFVSLLFLRLT